MGDGEEPFVDKLFANIEGSSPDCQLAIACVSGYVYGCAMTKIGKTLALATGGGIVLLQLANNHGIITIHYDEFRLTKQANVARMQNCQVGQSLFYAVERVYGFAKTNKVFSLGFIGGMLIGVGSCL